MPPAIDAVATSRLTGGGSDAVFTAGLVAAGDTLTVRNFNPPARAFLERILVHGVALCAFRVRSPAFHDNVEGVQIFPGEFPARRVLPGFSRQQLASQDAMVAEFIGIGAAATSVMVLGIFYEDIPGIQSRLHTWADVAPLVKTIKYQRVALAAGGAIGVWLDTAINVTENLLHANTDYAVLGYTTDTALNCIAIKGIDTGNLRIPGPGVLDSDVTTYYFKEWSDAVAGPRIPVFNAANAAGTFVSAVDKAAPVAGTNVQLLLAELAHPI